MDRTWKAGVSWSCLTGEAQMSIVWGKAGALLGYGDLVDGMRKTNERLKKLQFMETGRPGLDGGLPGSNPFDGEYGRYAVLNWAVKFFIDGLLVEHSLDEGGDMADLRRVW